MRWRVATRATYKCFLHRGVYIAILLLFDLGDYVVVLLLLETDIEKWMVVINLFGLGIWALMINKTVMNEVVHTNSVIAYLPSCCYQLVWQALP